MGASLVLVDTSAWVPFIRRQIAEASEEIDRLLAAERVASNSVVIAELLIGARDERQYHEFEADLGMLPNLPLTERVWETVSRVGFTLQRRGATVPLPDVVIAACALIHGCELFHHDRHFDLIARYAPLKFYKPTRMTAS